MTRNGSQNYSFGPNFEWRILQSPSIKEEVKAQEAQLKNQVNNYQRTIIQAIEEVESNLVGFNDEQKRLKQLTVALESAEKSAEIANSLYENGLRNYEAVIQSRLNLHDINEQVILNKESSSRSLVILYQSLGGGWNIQEKGIKEAQVQ